MHDNDEIYNQNLNVSDDNLNLSEEEIQAYLDAVNIDTPDLWSRIEAGFESEINLASEKTEQITDINRYKKQRRRKYYGILAAAVLMIIIAIPVFVSGISNKSVKSEEEFTTAANTYEMYESEQVEETGGSAMEDVADESADNTMINLQEDACQSVVEEADCAPSDAENDKNKADSTDSEFTNDSIFLIVRSIDNAGNEKFSIIDKKLDIYYVNYRKGEINEASLSEELKYVFKKAEYIGSLEDDDFASYVNSDYNIDYSSEFTDETTDDTSNCQEYLYVLDGDDNMVVIRAKGKVNYELDDEDAKIIISAYDNSEIKLN